MGKYRPWHLKPLQGFYGRSHNNHFIRLNYDYMHSIIRLRPA